MDLSWLFGDGSGEGENGMDYSVESSSRFSSVSGSEVAAVSRDFLGSVVAGSSVGSEAGSSGVMPRPQNVFNVYDLHVKFREILLRLSNPVQSLPAEVQIAEKLFNASASQVIHDFIDFCGKGMANCFPVVIGGKGPSSNLCIKTERNFKAFRVSCQTSKAWLSVLDFCVLDVCFETTSCLQHVLQHLWSTAKTKPSLSISHPINNADSHRNKICKA